MNKILLLCALWASFCSIITAQHIPDVAFANAIRQQCPTCIDANNNLLPDATNLDSLNLIPNSASYVTDLTGLNGFTSLNYLDCSNNLISIWPATFPDLDTLICAQNNIDSLPLLPSTLKYLDCSRNYIDTLPNLPLNLLGLDCSGNFLDSLINLPPNLISLNCGYNQITNISVFPQSLEYLSCKGNLLTSLSNLPTNLTTLYCDFNQLTDLIALPANLVTLTCEANSINNIAALPQSLNYFSCAFNRLIALPVLPPNLTFLNCRSNSLNILPPLPSNLETLNCRINQIIDLPTLPVSLTYLDCSDNILDSIPVLPSNLELLYCGGNRQLNCLPLLPISLTFLEFPNTAISCIPNFIAPQAYIRPINTPICMPNNISNCPLVVYSNIEGRVYLDNNNDGVFNNSDIPLANKLVYSNSNYTLASSTDSNGMYVLAVNFNDTSTVTIGNWLNTAYYSVTPNSYTISTNNSTQQFTNNDFRIVAINASTDVKISHNAGRYRPGFNTTFSVTYENVGNTIANGDVTITLDNQLAFLSATPAPNLVQLGRQLTFNYNNLQPFESRTIFISVNLSALVPRGSIIANEGIINSDNLDVLLSNNTFKTREIAVGSYDPNDINADKRAICMDLPDEIYQPITYKIRFQNTGTFYAENVVVTDTLSTMLDIRTFQQLNCSHDYRLEIENILRDGQPTQVLKWIFDDIFLLDSFTNEPLSHGFVNYKISPKTTPAINYGNVINSQAHIYFDFNPAVNTNINALVAQNCLNSLYETPANSYEFNILPNPNNGIFSLQVDKLQPTTSQAFVYNHLGQLVYQQTINLNSNLVTINCNHLQAGVYNLQIINEHSTATKSFVISR